MRTNVIACAIVKDEPKIAETVANVRAALGDACAGVVLHDTGSAEPTDGGADWIYFRSFDDFSSARNACLDDAETIAEVRGAEWLFMFSAGAVVAGVWTPADTDARALAHTERLGSTEFRKTCTVRVGSGLRFQGRTHEVIDVDVHALPHCGLTVDYTADWDIERKRKRWRLDIELLRNDYSARGRYYLAQSCELLGQRAEAFWYYAERLSRGGYNRERMQAAAQAVGVAPTMALAKWAANEAPSAEGYLALAERFERAKDIPNAKAHAVIALATQARAMFERTDFTKRCKEILEA